MFNIALSKLYYKMRGNINADAQNYDKHILHLIQFYIC